MSRHAQAVEVVAMLGDSVVGVKHCCDPNANGKVQRATYTLFAVAAVAMLVAGVAFWSAVETAAYNQSRYEYETTVLGKPRYSVRTRSLPRGCESIAFGALLASLVACTAAVLRMRREREGSTVRIGTAPGVDFPVAGAPAEDFALVVTQSDHFAVQRGDELVPVMDDFAARLCFGGATFLVCAIERPRRVPVPLFELDAEFSRILVGTAAMFAVFMLVVFQLPIEAESASIEISETEETFVSVDWPAPESAPSPYDGVDGDSGGSGTSMALDPGRMGNVESQRADGQYKIEGRIDPQLARQQAIEQARYAGILGSTSVTSGNAFVSLTGSFDASRGFDDTNIYGGKLGDEAGEMAGGFGYARSKFGPGGGGTGWGTICAGDFGTIGHGSGTGEGYGIGGGRCGTTCRGHVAATPSVSIGQPVAIGALDKAIIRRYIKRNIDKIRYCYEKTLLAKPGLSGTVSTQFFIAPDGHVSSAAAEGVDVEVASCVADVIEGISFPRPSEGAGVQVSYPFTFERAGE
ncbi:MAG TPA: AgmX/PglI C-terminal domain-containing protein [Kofleriaceae bacterium]|nr:AgmX/PglI C-terminal domain-containing protein [Kofleriaceae bacterium]